METTPDTGVTSDADIQSRMESFLVQFDKDQGQETEPAQPAAQAQPPEAETPETKEQPAELTAEDLPDVPVETPAVDAFEIVHNGKQHRLTREDTIKFAQQGFDYTQKTQAVAEAQRQVQQRLQRLAEIEQVQPMLAQEMAQVAALESQLRQYQKVDWVQLATADPLEYPKHRAAYDTLLQAYQSAAAQANHKASAVNQYRAHLLAQQEQQELARLPDLVPEWKSPERFDADRKAMTKYLSDMGADLNQVGKYLDNAVSMKVLRQSMLYEQLVKSKAEKVKQLRTAPPVTKPGAAQPVDNDQGQKLRDRLKRTGDERDAAALLMNRWK